jgi:hypothetical protein
VAGGVSSFLVVLAVGLAVDGYVRFRRRFVGWQDSLSELREDAIWLREWLGNTEANADGQ